MSRTRWEVCPECQGDGTRVHPAYRYITQDQLAVDDQLYYMVRSGTLPTVSCTMCKGRRVVDADMIDDLYDEQRERLDEIKLRAQENGDPELYFNPWFEM